MNREVHLTISIVVLAIFFFLFKQFEILQYYGYALAICLGAVLPDFLEPAKTPRHRKFFHSVKLLKILATWGLGLTLVIGIFSHEFFFAFFAIIGYILHLCLDFLTPGRLPKE